MPVLRRVLGVDGGYQTQGAAILCLDSVTGLSVEACKAWFLPTQAASHSSAATQDRGRKMLRSLWGEWVPQQGRYVPHILAAETWAGSRMPTTSYGRGFYDGMQDVYLDQYRLHYGCRRVSVPPGWVKASLHPTGKQTDKGRKSDVAFNQGLIELGRAGVEGLGHLQTPEFEAAGRRSWKGAREHTLDAAAVAWVGLLATVFSSETRRFEPIEGVEVPHREVHLRLFRKLADEGRTL